MKYLHPHPNLLPQRGRRDTKFPLLLVGEGQDEGNIWSILDQLNWIVSYITISVNYVDRMSDIFIIVCEPCSWKLG